jgi:hypothetical protein
MAGGGYINIAGQHASFNGAAYANSLHFKNEDLFDSEINLTLPAMSEDD